MKIGIVFAAMAAAVATTQAAIRSDAIGDRSSVAPEPSSYAVVGIGLISLYGLRKRGRRR